MNEDLQLPLAANAMLSLTTGGLFVIAGATVAGWLGLDGEGLWIRLAGVVLLGHAALIVLLASRWGTRTTAKVNLAAIAPYPALLIVLIATGVIDRTLGQGLALIDATLVGAIAVAHWFGLQKSVDDANLNSRDRDAYQTA